MARDLLAARRVIIFPGAVRPLVREDLHRLFPSHDARVVILHIDLDHAFVRWRRYSRRRRPRAPTDLKRDAVQLNSPINTLRINRRLDLEASSRVVGLPRSVRALMTEDGRAALVACLRFGKS